MHLKHLIIGYSFLLAFTGLGIYMSGIGAFVSIWASILGYSVIIYILHVIWAKIRAKNILGYFHFFSIFLYKIAKLGSIICLLAGFFVVYQNYIFPAKLPYYKLSNGEQNVHFQTMSHIASPDFYTQIRSDIFNAKKDGYVLYYEGVRPGSEENMDAFNEALGIKLDTDTYEKLSELYGIVAQDNAYFLGLINNRDYNVDLDMDTIMDIYRKKVSGSHDNSSGSLLSSNLQDIDVYVDNFSENEKKILRYVNQAFMNMIIKNGFIRESILSLIGKQDIFGVILDDRNRHLAHTISENSNKDIFVIYGLMHFDGVLELLQFEDTKWEIVETGKYQVIYP